MKIKIDNQTDYSTPWLRKIFNRCLRMVNRRMKTLKIRKDVNGIKYSLFYPIKQLRAEIVYKKSLTSWTGGFAYYNREFVHLELPRPPEKMIFDNYEKRRWNIDLASKDSILRWRNEQLECRKETLKHLPKRIAKTFVHELYHCYGYRHDSKEMFKPRKKQWIEETYNYDWVQKYPIQMKIEKPEKPKTDIQMKRYYRVLDLLKEKQGQLKRLQNAIKKYFAKKRYYENVLVGAGKLKKD